MSDEEEDDDGCDIFADSEKEEEDIEDLEENSRPVRKTIVVITWQSFRNGTWDSFLLLSFIFLTVSFCIIFVISFTLLEIMVEHPKLPYKYPFLLQMLRFYKLDHSKYIQNLKMLILLCFP